MTSRSTRFSANEDVLLCRMWLHVSQNPIIGTQQNSAEFWGLVTEEYNGAKNEHWEVHNPQSLQCRFNKIEKAIRKLNACYRQVENLHPSGASEQDMLDQAKTLLMNDKDYKKGFKFDHVWSMMKDVEKFNDGNSTRRTVRNQSFRFVSSELDNPTPESPMVSSPNLSSFSIHLNEDIAGECTSSRRPLGVKKTKLKKKLDDSFSHNVNRMYNATEKLVEELANSTAERQKARMEKSRALDLMEFREENKILLLNLDTIDDPMVRETFRREKARISEKRVRQQPPPSSTSNVYGQYFNNISGSGSDLPEY